MVVPACVPVRPDARACPELVEALPVPRHPFLDAAGTLRAECWLDADRGAARPACRRHMAGAIPVRRPDLKDAGAGKSAVREPSPADAVLDRLALVFRCLAAMLKPLGAAAERCKQDAGRSAA